MSAQIARLEASGIAGDRLAEAINHLAWLLNNGSARDIAEAEALSRRAVEIYAQVHGEDHWRTLNARDTLGAILIRAGRHEDAEVLFRGLATRSLDLFGDEHWLTAITRAHLGWSLLELGRVEAAEPVLVEAYPLILRHYGPDNEETRRVLQQLIDVCEALGRTEDAERYRDSSPGIE
jgi:Flp pilus assembly protein TadD